MVEFSILIIDLSRKMNSTYASQHLASQIIRSGTSVSLNYGEARSGESRRDFIHKLKIILKELRETHICLKIIDKVELCKDRELLRQALNENNELTAIIVQSIVTATQKLILKKN